MYSEMYYYRSLRSSEVHLCLGMGEGEGSIDPRLGTPAVAFLQGQILISKFMLRLENKADVNSALGN